MTFGVVVLLAAALGLTVRGLGSADEALASYDAASWMWSRDQGEVARVNGVNAKVDTRVDVRQARGHQVEVSQSDRFVLLRDVDTGAIASMDLADLQAFWKGESAPGVGVSVAVHEDAAFVVDAVQGKVQQIDPRTLQGIGEPLRFPPGISGGVFDGAGRLWIAASSEGTVTAIRPAPGTGDGAAPTRERTETVAAPSHDLALTTLEDGVAVLDRTTNELTRIGASKTTIRLPLSGPGIVPPHTDGDTIAVTVPGERRVYAVDETGIRSQVTVPGDGGRLRAAVVWQGYLYVADGDTVHVFDRSGQPRDDIRIPRPGGELELEVRENHLFINAPGASAARVVDDTHTVRPVDKAADDVLGGDPPPEKAPPPAPPKRKPAKPSVTEPGAPRNVRAAAGNAEARVTWQAAAANGAAISRYVVSGAGRTFQVGADQRSLVVTGLTNGETYRFRVHAVNRKGDGPARTSNAVRPTAEVPDPPGGAPIAEAKPDGSVTVTWLAANGQGRKIQRYTVTAIAAGGSAPLGDTTGTSLTVPGGRLAYGTQYAFTVVAVNDRGAGSQASAVSNSVVPFTKPGRPGNAAATTVNDQAGSIRVTWGAAADNGRPISKYVVTAGEKKTDVAGATTTVEVAGLGNGQNVPVTVVAVNEAGESEAASTSARTVAPAKVTVTGVTATHNAATVTFTADAGGGVPTCVLTVSGGGTGSSGNCRSLSATGLKPSTGYMFTVTVRNAAGAAIDAISKTTGALYGTASCINGDSGERKTYCDKDASGRNGNEIFEITQQKDNRQAGWVKHGTRLKAYCKKAGEEVNASVHNNHKRSTWWIQVDYQGRNYIPWVWLNLDGGDNLKGLPAC
ncbi:fibronectin type III domain-containing protein [Actinoplanes sp. NPDC024001]|uniref:fibronectin type III domain-containing protein n=1 Tax=Actinoplanes sp. NPDC024001 TaxID=3154598 RepID=UPI0033FF0FFF